MKNPEQHIGKTYRSASGANGGIYIVGILPEVGDFVVMSVRGEKIDYTKMPYRLDYFKATYRYKMD